MGNNYSQERLVSNFSSEEVSRLSKRFKKLDTDESGSVSLKELMVLPELKSNPLTKRVLEVFDTDSSGELDRTEFITGMAQFSTETDIEARLRFAFRIYDLDNDGFISNGELFQVLKVLVGNNLKDTQLQQLVDRTIMSVDLDQDGKVSFEEFCHMVRGQKMDQKIQELTSISKSI